MSPVLILIFIFCYVPMYGLLISFQDWTPGMPFMDFTGQTKWVGLKHFDMTRISGGSSKTPWCSAP